MTQRTTRRCAVVVIAVLTGLAAKSVWADPVREDPAPNQRVACVEPDDEAHRASPIPFPTASEDLDIFQDTELSW